MNWNNFHLFLAVATEGSIRKAAASLGMSHATLSRKLSAFEKAFGVALLERRGSKYILTQAGEDVFATSKGVDDKLQSLHLRLAGQDTRLEGTIRVTLSEMFLEYLAPDFGAFQKRHPDIELHIVAVNTALNLHQRDADVALRVTTNPPETLVGRRFGDFSYSACAHSGLLEAQGTADVSKLPWIGWDHSMQNYGGKMWMDEHVPDAQVIMRVDSPQAMINMVQAGVGIGHIPYIIERKMAEVSKLEGVDYRQAGELWLLTHQDIKKTARFRAFLDFLGDRLAKSQHHWDSKTVS
ncbi:MAG: DNA-binding transcriptional LysR family regulator [Limisphaerales bacterium]|jgi:DNA-binding transcriptional LysR family regulator